MGSVTANPRRAGAREAADLQLNGQSPEQRVGVRKYTEPGRLRCYLSKPRPSEVTGKQASLRLPPDAHPLRAPVPGVSHAPSAQLGRPSRPVSATPPSGRRVFRPGPQLPQLAHHTHHLLPEEVKLGFQPLQGAGVATSWGARGWGGRRGG